MRRARVVDVSAFVSWTLVPTKGKVGSRLAIASAQDAASLKTSQSQLDVFENANLVCSTSDCEIFSETLHGVHVRFEGAEPGTAPIDSKDQIRLCNLGSDVPIAVNGTLLPSSGAAAVGPGCIVQLGECEFTLERVTVAHA